MQSTESRDFVDRNFFDGRTNIIVLVHFLCWNFLFDCSMSSSSSSSSNEAIWLRILQINDVYELVNFPYFKTLVQEMQEGPDKTLVVLAGDFLGPSLLSSLDGGRGMVDTMNACGVTHVCFGNHETDVSMTDLAQRVLQSEFVWVNTNMRELDETIDVDTVPHDIVKITHGSFQKKIAILGLLTEDPSLYRPGSFGGAKIEPVLDATEQYLTQLLPLEPDLIIPLTHQRMPEDREFCNKFTGNSFPIVIGGHDHEPYDETHSGARIVKTGLDAQNTAIIDIKWSISPSGEVSNKPSIEVDMVPTTTFAPDPVIKALVKGHERVIYELDRAKLFRIADWIEGRPDSCFEHTATNGDDAEHKTEKLFSTANNRLGPTNGSTILTSMLRMGMRANCAILNAGTIRANKVYPKEQEWFTWSDLKAEIPFTTEMSAFYVPGHVLRDTIVNSRRGVLRNPPVSSGGYLHTCDQIVMNEAGDDIVTIRDEPFDPDKLYLTAMPTKFMAGIDNHVPLLNWAKQENIVVDDEMGLPAKMLIVQMFSALLWLNMGSFETIDTNHDGLLTRDDVRQRAVEVFGEEVADLVVDNIMSVADLRHTGYITPLDMMVVQFVASDMIKHVCTTEELSVMSKVASEVLGKRPSHADVRKVVKDLRDCLDIKGDGRIQREEAMQVLGEVKRRSLLV
jgi:2',3'-cyclic-nucleotide 2'-phosphodiesterase (5'-nucleotidase family)